VLQPPGKAKKEPAPDTKSKKVKGADVAGRTISTSAPTGSKAVALPVSPILSDSWGWHPGVHDGIDLICNPSATLTAICEAQVIRADPGGWWGLGAPSNPEVRAKGDGIIILRALVDTGPIKKGMNFCYGHAESPQVTVGQTVSAGDVIGKAGFANAWHVHFMVNARSDDRGVGDRDPLPFVQYLQQHGSGSAAARHPRT
jgi:murein DD-endopeptidase MepM/ murein hydrolase activator NlpD